jgi:hypothetical protein
MLAVAIIRISERSKLLKTCNIGTLTVPEHPIVIVFQPKRNWQYAGSGTAAESGGLALTITPDARSK